MDVVAAWHLDSKFGTTTVQAAVNANRTRVVERGRYVDAKGQSDLERGLPEWRGVATARHLWRDLDAMVRARYYGEYQNTRTADLVDIQVSGGEVMVDAELTTKSALIASSSFTRLPGPNRVGESGPSDGLSVLAIR